MLLQEEKEDDEEEDGKNVESTFYILRMSYIRDQPTFVYWLFFTHFSP